MQLFLCFQHMLYATVKIAIIRLYLTIVFWFLCRMYIHLCDYIYIYMISFQNWESILQFPSCGFMKLEVTICYYWCPIVMKWSQQEVSIASPLWCHTLRWTEQCHNSRWLLICGLLSLARQPVSFTYLAHALQKSLICTGACVILSGFIFMWFEVSACVNNKTSTATLWSSFHLYKL